MKATKQQKSRFQKNLTRFVKMKAEGKLNGSAADVKAALKDGANGIGLDFGRELQRCQTVFSGGQTVPVDNKRRNPVTFIETAEGKLNFGKITEKIARQIGRQAGYIRLTQEGFKHIESHRGEIQSVGFDSILQFIEMVAGNFEIIYKGKGRSLMLAIKNKPRKMAFVELNPTSLGEFYLIKSAFPVRSTYFKKKKLLWEKAPSTHRNNAAPSAVSGRSSSVNKDKEIAVKRETIVDTNILTGLECLEPGEVRENKSVTPDEIYQDITDMIINTIREVGHLPWQQKWKDTGFYKGFVAINFISKKPYRGINYFMLNFEQKKVDDKWLLVQKQFSNPYFLTFNQIDELGGTLDEGSVGQMVVYFTKLYKIKQEDPDLDFGTYDLDEMTAWIEEHKSDIKNANGRSSEQIARSSYIPILKYYRVYNAEDIQGIDWGQLPKNENEQLDNPLKLKVGEAIYDHYPSAPEIKHIQAEAYYVPDADYINMPKQSSFDEQQYYYTTLFHEAIHSTGNKSRLDRKVHNKKGSKDYAFEELIAEMGAVFLCAESGILFRTIHNSAKYLHSWNKRLVSAMKKDDHFFFRASSRAQEAADYILDRNDTGQPAYFKDEEYQKIQKEKKTKNEKNSPKAVSIDGPYSGSPMQIQAIAKEFDEKLMAGAVGKFGEWAVIDQILTDLGIAKKLSDEKRKSLIDELSFIVRNHFFSSKLPPRLPRGSRQKWGLAMEGIFQIKPLEKNIQNVRKTPSDTLEIAESLKPVTSDDDLRPAMQCVYQDGDQGVLVATEGHIILEIPHSSISKNKLIDVNATGCGVMPFPDYQQVWPEQTTKIYKTPIKPLLGKLKYIARAKRFTDLSTICGLLIYKDHSYAVDTALLYRLLKSMHRNGVKKVSFNINPKDSNAAWQGIVIKDTAGSGIKGDIMPRKNEINGKEVLSLHPYMVIASDETEGPAVPDTMRSNPYDKEIPTLSFVDESEFRKNPLIEKQIHDTIVHAQRLENFGHDNSDDLKKLDELLGRDGWKWNDRKTQILRVSNNRQNPKADWIYLGVSKQLVIDQPDGSVVLEGPQAMLTNKPMNKLYITPFDEISGFSGDVKDGRADKAFEVWNNYQPDDQNYSLQWPDNEESLPVGHASEIIYISDKIMQPGDQEGQEHTYRHEFDAGKRPAFKKGNMLIIENLSINQRGILN